MMHDRTGQRAVDFRLRDTTDGVHTLDEYHGAWLLLVFHRHLG